MKLISIFTIFLGSQCLAFAPSLWRYPSQSFFSSWLYAEGGAPQYDKRTGILKEAQVVAEGSVMLHIERADEEPIEYEPGHVLALEIQGDLKNTEGFDEKTIKDMEKNNGWMRAPFTVTRGMEDSFDILIRVVGTKSKTLATAKPGTPVRFGGKFHVPIVEGIATTSKRVVMITTGVGVGPCIGAVEKLVSEGFDGAVGLFASYRHESEKVLVDYMNDLSTAHENFLYRPVITSDVGRISSTEDNIRLVLNDGICSLEDTHYHLVGNGQMVNEWKAGLAKAGVAKERVTIETYFNHASAASEEVVDRIASVITKGAFSPAASL